MTSLTFVLRLNALSCLGFGAAFMIGPSTIAIAVGSVPPPILTVLGIVLLANGVHLGAASLRRKPIRAEVLWFSFGDLIWWLVTLALIASNVWITTRLGIVLALVIAVGVATMGVTQLFLLGVERSGLKASSHWRQIGQSWLALPKWVKLWLFALNVLFLVSPFFLPWWIASVVLVGYVASGPLLLACAVFYGGLTRIMGLAHVLPWVPMLGWFLVVVITTADLSAAELTFLWLLVTMTALCLLFDVYDAGRWLSGDRKILTS